MTITGGTSWRRKTRRTTGGFFQQPPGLFEKEGKYVPNPEAENIGNLHNGHGYYLNQVGGKTKEWIKVYVMGQYGTVQDGKPVYPEYKDETHYPGKQIRGNPSWPLILGWDFGLTPACVICQITPVAGLSFWMNWWRSVWGWSSLLIWW